MNMDNTQVWITDNKTEFKKFAKTTRDWPCCPNLTPVGKKTKTKGQKKTKKTHFAKKCQEFSDSEIETSFNQKFGSLTMRTLER